MNDNINQNFSDIHVTTSPEYKVAYRCGDMVYEERFANGTLMSGGFNAAGFLSMEEPHIDTNTFEEPSCFNFEINGQSMDSHWILEDFGKQSCEKGLLGIMTLKSSLQPVKCRVFTVLDGTGILTRWLEIENNSNRDLAIGHISPMCGGLDVIAHWKRYVNDGTSLYRLGYMEDTITCGEGNFKWHDLPNAEYGVCGVYRRDRHRHPFFVLENRATGLNFICQFAWSGGYRFLFDLDADLGIFRDDARLSFSVELDAKQPLKLLAPGEKLATPAVHIGAHFGGLDAAIHRMHNHTRRSVIHPQARGRGCWVEAGELATSREHTLAQIDKAAERGVEVFFIDAGWYNPPDEDVTKWDTRLGVWIPDLDRYPGGIAEIREYCHEKKLLFGLWMEPERVKYGPVLDNHPDWFVPEKKKRPGAGGGVYSLNLNIPQAAQWMESEIVRVIEEYQCDFFRLDFNANHRVTADGTKKGDFFENNYITYYQVLYGIFERIRQRFPDVILENCASGGGRTDLGIMENFCHTWITDWPVAPRSFSILNGMTMALPPEYINRVFVWQKCYTKASFDFQIRQLLFVSPNFPMLNPGDCSENPWQVECVKKNIAFYKHFIRPFLPESKIYHHTPEFGYIEAKGFGILELDSKSGDRGILGVFQLSSPSDDNVRIRLRGIDKSKQFRVTFDNREETCVVSGYQLTNEGIYIYLDGALISELVYYESI